MSEPHTKTHSCVGCLEDQAGLISEVPGSLRPGSPFRSAFAAFRFPAEVIVVALRWYLRYGLSYRDIEELLPNAASTWTTSRSTGGCSGSPRCWPTPPASLATRPATGGSSTRPMSSRSSVRGPVGQQGLSDRPSRHVSLRSEGEQPVVGSPVSSSTVSDHPAAAVPDRLERRPPLGGRSSHSLQGRGPLAALAGGAWQRTRRRRAPVCIRRRIVTLYPSSGPPQQPRAGGGLLRVLLQGVG
jgi:hypothetical protein